MNVTIGNGVKAIEDSAFSNCISLTNVIFGNSITNIGANAFINCKALTDITIPDSVVTVSDDAFKYCHSLTSVTIGNGTTTIGDYTFSDCTGLTSVIISNSVTSIGRGAFYSDSKLEYIDLTAYGTERVFPTLGSQSAFTGCGTATTKGTFEIRVPAGRKDELATMANWKTYAENIVEV